MKHYLNSAPKIIDFMQWSLVFLIKYPKATKRLDFCVTSQLMNSKRGASFCVALGKVMHNKKPKTFWVEFLWMLRNHHIFWVWWLFFALTMKSHRKWLRIQGLLASIFERTFWVFSIFFKRWEIESFQHTRKRRRSRRNKNH